MIKNNYKKIAKGYNNSIFEYTKCNGDITYDEMIGNKYVRHINIPININFSPTRLLIRFDKAGPLLKYGEISGPEDFYPTAMKSFFIDSINHNSIETAPVIRTDSNGQYGGIYVSNITEENIVLDIYTNSQYNGQLSYAYGFKGIEWIAIE